MILVNCIVFMCRLLLVLVQCVLAQCLLVCFRLLLVLARCLLVAWRIPAGFWINVLLLLLAQYPLIVRRSPPPPNPVSDLDPVGLVLPLTLHRPSLSSCSAPCWTCWVTGACAASLHSATSLFVRRRPVASVTAGNGKTRTLQGNKEAVGTGTSFPGKC